mmetsp:Transcript_51974/g.129382  ORF Transcript_51974/g.129382 Transcript_51974/m.129382 type:complete len:209 (+) Transcript_51974:303-929(+)
MAETGGRRQGGAVRAAAREGRVRGGAEALPRGARVVPRAERAEQAGGVVEVWGYPERGCGPDDGQPRRRLDEHWGLAGRPAVPQGGAGDADGEARARLARRRGHQGQHGAGVPPDGGPGPSHVAAQGGAGDPAGPGGGEGPEHGAVEDLDRERALPAGRLRRCPDDVQAGAGGAGGAAWGRPPRSCGDSAKPCAGQEAFRPERKLGVV